MANNQKAHYKILCYLWATDPTDHVVDQEFKQQNRNVTSASIPAGHPHPSKPNSLSQSPLLRNNEIRSTLKHVKRSHRVTLERYCMLLGHLKVVPHMWDEQFQRPASHSLPKEIEQHSHLNNAFIFFCTEKRSCLWARSKQSISSYGYHIKSQTAQTVYFAKLLQPS